MKTGTRTGAGALRLVERQEQGRCKEQATDQCQRKSRILRSALAVMKTKDGIATVKERQARVTTTLVLLGNSSGRDDGDRKRRAVKALDKPKAIIIQGRNLQEAFAFGMVHTVVSNLQPSTAGLGD